jgi:transposase-like protein
MRKRKIQLSARDRASLEKFSTTGKHDVRLVTRAKIILALDTSGGRTAERRTATAERLGISRQTVNNVKRDFLAAKSLTVFLQRKQRETPPVPAKVTGELEARIIALACSEAPNGYSRWTLRLLADKCVKLYYSKTMSHMTISRLLKKHNLSLT